MDVLGLTLAALGLIFLTATGLAQAWTWWAKRRQARRALEQPEPGREFDLMPRARTEAPADELADIELIPEPEPAATIETQATPPLPPLKARRAAKHRRPERLGQFFKDLAKELGF
jgi:hypothetical protein